MTRFVSVALIVAIGTHVTPSCHLVHAQSRAADPAGSWKMTIQFSDEARPAGLELILKGRAVSGKFVASFAGGEVPIEGEFADGTLTFQASTTGGPHPGMSLDFTATLKDNATLAGTLSAPFGDIAWTAERIR